MIFDPMETIERKDLVEPIGKYFPCVNTFHDVDLLKPER